MDLQQAITEFRGQFRGAIIQPEDAAYDEARKVYNGMILNPAVGATQNPHVRRPQADGAATVITRMVDLRSS
jgi:hypothetical protein